MYALPCHVAMRYCDVYGVFHSLGMKYACVASNMIIIPVVAMNLTDRRV